MSADKDLRPEYDFSTMKGGVRGKYAERLREAGNIIVLEDDVADAFPTDAAVNEALRAVLKAASVIHPKPGGAEQVAAADGASRRG
jgi:hypothetical protein